MKKAASLQSMSEVVEYWDDCLRLLKNGINDQDVAALMVNVTSNERDEVWGGSASHPAYGLIFELVGSLELPPPFTGQTDERWSCVRALLEVLREASDSA